MLVTSIFSFSNKVSILPNKIPIFRSHLFCRLQKAINLDQPQILSFGKELYSDHDHLAGLADFSADESIQ